MVKGREYHQLVESYRQDGKVKQRVIRHIGKAELAELGTTAAPATTPPAALAPVDPIAPPFYSAGLRVWFKYCADIPYRATIAQWDGKYYMLNFDDPNLPGDICRQGRVLPDRILGRVFEVGDWVKFIDCQGGEMFGTVIEGTTQSEACPWPRRLRGSREIVEIPHQPPATVTVKYQWLTETIITTMPVGRVWYPASTPPMFATGGPWERCN